MMAQQQQDIMITHTPPRDNTSTMAMARKRARCCSSSTNAAALSVHNSTPIPATATATGGLSLFRQNTAHQFGQNGSPSIIGGGSAATVSPFAARNIFSPSLAATATTLEPITEEENIHLSQSSCTSSVTFASTTSSSSNARMDLSCNDNDGESLFPYDESSAMIGTLVTGGTATQPSGSGPSTTIYFQPSNAFGSDMMDQHEQPNEKSMPPTKRARVGGGGGCFGTQMAQPTSTFTSIMGNTNGNVSPPTQFAAAAAQQTSLKQIGLTAVHFKMNNNAVQSSSISGSMFCEPQSRGGLFCSPKKKTPGFNNNGSSSMNCRMNVDNRSPSSSDGLVCCHVCSQGAATRQIGKEIPSPDSVNSFQSFNTSAISSSSSASSPASAPKSHSLLSYFQPTKKQPPAPSKPHYASTVTFNNKHFNNNSISTTESTTTLLANSNNLAPCRYCDKQTCHTCTRTCEQCQHQFCTFCTKVDYESSVVERILCFECDAKYDGDCDMMDL